jgi:CHASE2 domain-containing sensor protein
VKFKVAIRNPRIRSAVGAALAAVLGLALWGSTLSEQWQLRFGEPLVNASYDYLFFFFGRHDVTNKVVLVLMDTESYDTLKQQRGPLGWSRLVHAQFVNQLADDKCPLVVFDIRFAAASDDPADVALLSALPRLDRVALMAKLRQGYHPRTPGAEPLRPAPEFMAAAKSNYGVAWFNPEYGIVRKHWPFPAPQGLVPSLPWTAAKLAGAELSEQPQWLRFYGFGKDAPFIRLSYHHALTQSNGFFSDKIVFIGNQPASTSPSRPEDDKFNMPYVRWEDEACGGVEVVATAFLNLMNHDWLRRPHWAIEGVTLLLTGALLGGFLCRLKPMIAFGTTAACALGVTLMAVGVSTWTNYWFPWLVVVGGQVPCALVWGWVTRPRLDWELERIIDEIPAIPEPVIDAPDYQVFEPFAQGSFGTVWLVRNAIGQWQALKKVEAAKFGENTPYELEFTGISNYKPISDKHPGLLHVDFVCIPKPEGYFYYVMELGDAITPGWETDTTTYKPRDLASMIREAPRNRLPIAECVRIVGLLAEALDFLHQQGFTHRDVKPSNIIFVKGRPKLADVGLVREIRPADEVKTWAGTLGYMPPNEPPGTVAADIYALGMVLYVISTGKPPAAFSELSSTLAATVEVPEFIRLNSIILKACNSDRASRYATAAELCAALAEVQKMREKSAAERSQLPR